MSWKFRLVLPLLLISIFACQSDKKNSVEAIKGIPTNATCIIEVHRFDRLFQGLESSALTQRASEAPLFLSIKSSLENLAEAIVLEGDNQSFFLSKPGFISMHMIGVESSSFLYTRSLIQDEASFSPLFNHLKSKYLKNQKNYDGATIFSFEKDGQHFAMAAYRDVLLISPEEVLIEDAIRQINSGISLLQDPHFAKLRSTANKKDDANIYMNYEGSSDFFEQYFPQNKLDWIENVAHWTEMDLSCKNDGLLMNGLSFSSDSLGHILSIFSGNEPQKLSVFEAAPKNTAAMVAIGVENYGKFHESYRQWLRKNNQLMRYEKNMATIGPVSEIESSFQAWMTGEFALFITETKSDLDASSLLVIKSKDAQLAEKQLEKWSDSFSDNYRGSTIKRIAFNSLFGNLLGDWLSNIRKPYYASLGNYLVFANDLSQLRAAINAYRAKSTLANDNHFQSFYDHLNPRSNVFVYLKNPGAKSLIELLTQSKVGKKELMATASSAAIQFSIQKNLAYTNAFIYLKENKGSDHHLNWTAQLDTGLLAGPFLVKNHYNKHGEILVQDQSFNLYHFDAYGQLLWKQNLGEAIMGEVHLVDRYKNNKYQFLFNTKTKIHLLDRKGRKVEDYPIVLPKPATQALTLFDFDKNRRYRLAQVCGKQVFYYNIDAKIVKGWKFTEAPTEIIRSPQHFSAYGKDFILFPEASGKVNILNRQGKPRVKPDYDFSLSDNPFYLEQGKKLSTTRLITTSREGAFYYIFMNDEIDIMKQDLLTEDHYFAQKRDARILYDQGRLKIIKGDEVFRYDFDGTPQLEFVLPNAGQGFVGAVDAQAGKVYLFDSQAEILPGFPVYGTSTFVISDLNRDGKEKLVVGSSEGSLYCYTLSKQ